MKSQDKKNSHSGMLPKTNRIGAKGRAVGARRSASSKSAGFKLKSSFGSIYDISSNAYVGKTPNPDTGLRNIQDNGIDSVPRLGGIQNDYFEV